MKREYSSLFKETNTIVTVSGDEAEEKAVDEVVKKGINLMSVFSSLEKTVMTIKGRSQGAGSVTSNSTIRKTALNTTRGRGLRVRKLKSACVIEEIDFALATQLKDELG